MASFFNVCQNKLLNLTIKAGSKIAGKITSLKMSGDQEPQEELEEKQEIIIPPNKRQQIIDDLRLF